MKSFLSTLILCILREKECHGYELIRLIRKEFGVWLSPGTIYPALYALERTGVIRWAWDDPKKKLRKQYSLTPEGESQCREELRYLENYLRRMGKLNLR